MAGPTAIYARVLIAVPRKLTSEQRDKLQEFADLLGDEVPPPHKSLFERAREFFQ